MFMRFLRSNEHWRCSSKGIVETLLPLLPVPGGRGIFFQSPWRNSDVCEGDAVTAWVKSANVSPFRSVCGCQGHETLKLDASHPAEPHHPNFRYRNVKTPKAVSSPRPMAAATMMSFCCFSFVRRYHCGKWSPGLGRNSGCLAHLE